MDPLTKLTFALDARFKELFNTYKLDFDLEYPEYGFLSDDCFSPGGEEECYACVHHIFKHLLNIYEKIHEHFPAQIHAYLGEIYAFVEQIKKHCKSVGKKHPAYGDYAAIQNLLASVNNLLSNYKYKENSEYKSNSAILTLSMLIKKSKPSRIDNIDTKQSVFYIPDTKVILTLEDIAKLIQKATGVTERNLQFIAIGICNNGNYVVTTNYHAPTVFQLEDLLDKDRYQAINLVRKKTTSLIFGGDIHAETMIASLSESLGVNAILLTDGQGKKKQNCSFCSSYLHDHGFKSEPHADIIKNYKTPTEYQVKQACDWFKSLISTKIFSKKSKYKYIKQEFDQTIAEHEAEPARQTYQKILPMLDAKSQANFQKGDVLEECFKHVKTEYPHDLLVVNGLKQTYHLSSRLAHPEAPKLARTINSKGNIAQPTHPNDHLRFFDDGRIKISDDKKHLVPTDPNSPRTTRLTRKVNKWIDEAGEKNSKVRQDLTEGIFEITRNTKSM